MKELLFLCKRMEAYLSINTVYHNLLIWAISGAEYNKLVDFMDYHRSFDNFDDFLKDFQGKQPSVFFKNAPSPERLSFMGDNRKY